MNNTFYEVVLSTYVVELHISVNKKLKKQKGNLINFGYIDIVKQESNEESVNWDNLEWFFDIDEEKEKELIDELKEKNLYNKGVIKDIKKLIKKAIKLNLLTKKIRK